MSSYSPWRRLGQALWVPALCLAVLAYVGVNAIGGNRGLTAHERMDAETRALKAELTALKDERELLEKQITLMRPDTLDPDMLDERVRAVLNFAGEGELTILRPKR